jgi:hypothetical protein
LEVSCSTEQLPTTWKLEARPTPPPNQIPSTAHRQIFSGILRLLEPEASYIFRDIIIRFISTIVTTFKKAKLINAKRGTTRIMQDSLEAHSTSRFYVTL